MNEGSGENNTFLNSCFGQRSDWKVIKWKNKNKNKNWLKPLTNL